MGGPFVYCGLAITGGSFAKILVRIWRNSTIVALYFELLATGYS